MCEQQLIHATLVEINGKGVLLRGKSGVGKSDLALRLIERKGAILVADDMVILASEEGRLIGLAPDNLRGLLEVRGVGIVQMPFAPKAAVDLIVDVTEDAKNIERMPKAEQENILGVEIKRIDLYAKENSAPEKVMIKLFGSLLNDTAL
jgi:serine kinase of HPr protein (carbohydrate metabolism regulator)